MTDTSLQSRPSGAATAVGLLRVAVFLYLFLLSIGLLGSGFKLLGAGFARALVAGTTNPLLGLFIGILATSIAQSSSLTTSIVVGLVASGSLSPTLAVPVVMGANIGTSVTNTIVSLGHVTRHLEFEKAFAAATVHDIFNWCAVVIILPLEITTHFLSRTSVALAQMLGGSAGIEFRSPVKLATAPVIGWVKQTLAGSGLTDPFIAAVLLVVSLAVLFLSLTQLTRTMKGILLTRLQPVLSTTLTQHSPLALLFGVVFTVLVQSSSVTTSLLVPLAAAGILSLEQVYPVTLGANIGTTVTALLAASVGNVAGLAIALAHLLFNLLGLALFFLNPWGRHLIPWMTRLLAAAAARNRAVPVLFVLVGFFVLPALAILLWRIL
ncbi:MAG: hypothetical protein GF355_13090 [Candidatus Eisenbacteria bacterium]|nr:hypothetical protein [Candidatus Eisenbacteria bacterium]